MTLAVSLAGPEAMIIVALILLMFGSRKVPELARSLGRAQREFKDGMLDTSIPAESLATVPVDDRS